MSICCLFAQYNITWKAPKDPNSLVLKYDIEITHVSTNYKENINKTGHSRTVI